MPKPLILWPPKSTVASNINTYFQLSSDAPRLLGVIGPNGRAKAMLCINRVMNDFLLCRPDGADICVGDPIAGFDGNRDGLIWTRD